MSSVKKTEAPALRLEGGARLSDSRKSTIHDGLPLISVVTVVFNDVKNIQRTIDSVASQTYANIEHIIIDGGSVDGTLDVIRGNVSIDFWVSEKDSGIYDAMNKGISAATGEWINFMNSGDVFFDYAVLETVFNNPDARESDLIYGDVEVDYGGFKKNKQVGAVSALKQGMQFSHQSLFVARSVLNAVFFDVSYRTAADYNFIIRSWVSGCSFYYAGLVISSISAGGVSDIRRKDSHRQRVSILTHWLDLSMVDRFKLWMQGVYIFFADKVKLIFPVFLSDWIKKIK